jgi:hypothetical protein
MNKQVPHGQHTIAIIESKKVDDCDVFSENAIIESKKVDDCDVFSENAIIESKKVDDCDVFKVIAHCVCDIFRNIE